MFARAITQFVHFYFEQTWWNFIIITFIIKECVLNWSLDATYRAISSICLPMCMYAYTCMSLKYLFLCREEIRSYSSKSNILGRGVNSRYFQRESINEYYHQVCVYEIGIFFYMKCTFIENDKRISYSKYCPSLVVYFSHLFDSLWTVRQRNLLLNHFRKKWNKPISGNWKEGSLLSKVHGLALT